MKTLKLLFSLMFVFTFLNIQAQNEIVKMPEQKAVFEGGEVAMQKYIVENLKYPKYAKENSLEGTVFIKFLVSKDGKIGKVTVLKGVHKTMDIEATRVIQNMPIWSPAVDKGKKVDSEIVLPVKFQLD